MKKKLGLYVISRESWTAINGGMRDADEYCLCTCLYSGGGGSGVMGNGDANFEYTLQTPTFVECED